MGLIDNSLLNITIETASNHSVLSIHRIRNFKGITLRGVLNRLLLYFSFTDEHPSNNLYLGKEAVKLG
jgi:hypothetical protein